MAANFWPSDSDAEPLASNPATPLHNPVTLPYY